MICKSKKNQKSFLEIKFVLPIKILPFSPFWFQESDHQNTHELGSKTLLQNQIITSTFVISKADELIRHGSLIPMML